ncbi:MAG: hypothetical protein KDJ14_04340 [Xanthomonadales bacterium]|nr:hypothetical protein [Xanthomonadales bacterium]
MVVVEQEQPEGASALIPAWIALGVVGLAGVYLLVLGAAAIFRPALASAFLLGFASTAWLHFAELALRVLVGACLLVAAPSMPGADVFRMVGVVLVATSVLMALVPWRFHRQFAERAVPKALQHLGLVGVCSAVGGGLMLACAGIGATS